MVEVHTSQKAGYRVLLVVLWFTLLILSVKVWASWAMRSLSLLADTLHVFVDCFSTLLSLYHVSLLRQTAGRELWGHRRGETIAVLGLVAMLGFLGFTLLGVSSYQLYGWFYQVSLLPALQVDGSLLLILGIVIAIHLCLVLFERYEAGVLQLSTLRHNANHVLQDIWLPILIGVGLVGVMQGYEWLDAAMAIFSLLMLLPGVWNVLRWQVPSMSAQVAIAPEMLCQLAKQIEGVAECRKVYSQGLIGRPIFIRMYLTIEPEFMSEADVITKRLENEFRDRFGDVQTKIYVRHAKIRWKRK